MVEISEIDAIKTIDHTLSQIADSGVRDRILRWAWEKHSSQPLPAREDTKQKKAKPSGRVKKAKTGPKSRTKVGPTIVKDLNLKPQSKPSFVSFAQAKRPKSDQGKCVVAVYYLRQELGMANVGADHVFTCFKDARWRVPANLDNTLRVTASVKGWLNTSDMNKIKLTPHGENLIDHDLPKKSKGGE